MKHLKALSSLVLAFVLLVFLSSAAGAQTAITVSGQLTNGLGEPMPGQQIGLGGPTNVTTTTDANGRYAISVPAGNYSLQIGQFIHQTEHYDTSTHVPPYYRLQTSSFDILQNTTLNLQIPFKKLSVHVQDSQGTAAANVFVNADGGNTYNLAIGSLPTGTLLASGNSYFDGAFVGVVTNTNGDVDYWLLPTSADPSACGSWGCGYSVTAQPTAASGLALTSMLDVALTQDSSVTITLQPGVSLTGRVTDAQGNPLSGLLVTLRGYYPTSGAALITDANGRYGFSVSPGTYSLKVDKTWDFSKPYDSWDFELQSYPFEVTQNMTLDLAPFKRVSVHVVDGNGQPVAGTGLAASGGGSMTIGGVSFSGSGYYSYNPSLYVNSVVTDASGNATLSLLPGGNTLTAYPPGRPAVSYSSVLVTGDISLTLRLDGTILANVPTLSSISPASAEVMGPDFTLVVTGTDFVDSSVVRWNGADRSTTYVSSMQLTAVIPTTDIAIPGTVNVTVWTPAPGGGESNSLPFTINPAPPVILSGRITDAEGTGLPNQSITLYKLIGFDWPSGLTDASGHYALSVSPGYYMPRVQGGVPVDSTLHAPQNYDVHVDPIQEVAIVQNTTLDFTLPFQRVNVHVVDANDQPVGGVGLRVYGAPAYGLTFGGLSFSGYNVYSYDADLGAGLKTDSNGNATLWLFPASDPANGYTIEAYPSYETGLSPASLNGVLVTGETNVTVRFTGVLPVKVPTVSGQVTDAQGNPLSGLTVGLRFWPGEPSGVEVTTDANGRYALSAPTAGSYSLSVGNGQPWGCTINGTGPFGWWCFYLESPGSWFEVNQNMTLNLALPFKRVNVHTVDANGQPMAGVGLETSQPRSDLITIGGMSFSGYSYYFYDTWVGDGTRTDANGNATFWLFPSSDPNSGGYTITGYPPSETGLPSKSQPGLVVTGDTSVTISFSAFTLSGRITDADGNGLPGQFVVLGNGSPSDSNGYYTITNYPGNYALGISGGVPFSSPLHAPRTYWLDSEPISFTQNMRLDFALPFQKVNVHVTDANYQPVEGAILDARATRASQVTINGIAFSGYSTYWHSTSGGITTDVNGNATLWLFRTSDPLDGYSISAYGPSGKGLTSVTLGSVLVNGETSVTLRFDGALPAKVPVLSSMSPSSVAATSPSFTLVVTGTDFIKTSVVRWNGADHSTTFVSNTLLTATIPITDIASAGTANVTVWTPAPGGGESSALKFTILPPPDRTAPTVSAKGTTSTGDYTFGQWVTQTVQITLTAQDNEGGTGVKKITYAASGAQSIPVTEVVSSTATISINAEGATQITYSAVDNAGNRAADQTVLVKIDQTPPTLGTCPAAGPFLFNSGPQSIGPIVASDVPAGLDAASSQLSGSVDTSSLGVKTVAFLAKDLAGNSSDKSCDYTVLPSATLKVFTALHTVGAGTTPGVQKTPLAMSVKIFDLATVPSADVANYASVWNSGPGLVAPLAFVSAPSATTFGGGQANLYAVQVSAADSANKVTSGKYLVIGKVEGAETYVGAATDPLAPNSVTQEYLQVVQKSDGKKVPAVTTSVPGSLLLIVEPAYLEFTTNTELFPIIYDAVDGTWEAVVKTDPPQGFISTPGALSVDVSTGQLAAVQFTVQDVGSQWTTTKVTNRIKHKGVDKTITSSVAMINRQPAITKTPTPTVTRTATLTPTAIVTATRTLTPTRTATATASATPTAMPKPTGTSTATPTATTVPTKTSTATPTPLPTQRPGSPGTATPKKSRTATPTATAAPSRTATSTPTKASTATPTRLPAQTLVPTTTATPKKAPTAKPTATRTLPPTKTPHLTATPRNTPAKR